MPLILVQAQVAPPLSRVAMLVWKLLFCALTIFWSAVCIGSLHLLFGANAEEGPIAAVVKFLISACIFFVGAVLCSMLVPQKASSAVTPAKSQAVERRALERS
jgi:hypothetical protein